MACDDFLNILFWVFGGAKTYPEISLIFDQKIAKHGSIFRSRKLSWGALKCNCKGLACLWGGLWTSCRRLGRSWDVGEPSGTFGAPWGACAASWGAFGTHLGRSG